MKRREALQSLAALAAGRLAAGDGPVEASEVDKPASGDFHVGSIEPKHLAFNLWGQLIDADVGGRDVDEKAIDVWGNHQQINLSQDCDVSDAYAGSYATMDPDTARELAVAIYMAAEEADRRPDK